MRKVFVEVNCAWTKDGQIIPRQIIWEDGQSFEIDKVLETKRAASLKAGGQGLRYTCRIGGNQTYLFLEDNSKWFVEGK
ncbi:MAG: hypothetical protein HGA22_02390 [Clostridiales bacterium]|nr:hypothetical protein [Clostridiales bacterium]